MYYVYYNNLINCSTVANTIQVPGTFDKLKFYDF